MMTIKKPPLFVLALFIMALPLVLWAASNIWVSVQKSVVRKSPSFLGAQVATVAYQQPMLLLEDKGDWWKVEIDDKQGWIHHSAVSTSLVVTAQVEKKQAGSGGFGGFNLDGSPDTGTTISEKKNDDITLAGKGFNQQAEAHYRQAAANLDYQSVDMMEQRPLGDFDLNRFASAGGLNYLEPKKWDFDEAKSSGFSSGNSPFSF
jgi:hypothetical protein